MSDDSEKPGKSYCLQNDHRCRKCNQRGCNNDLIQWEKPMSCIKCTSTEDTDCEKSPELLSANECAPTAAGYENKCYTRVVNQTVERGCFYEASAEAKKECDDSADESCSTCTEPGCNQGKVYIGEHCYECDSAQDSNCEEKVGSYMEKNCNWSRKGCYLIRQNSQIKSE